MKTYHGYRIYGPDSSGGVAASRCLVRVEVEGRPGYDLPQRQDLRNHSPTGFEWGYGGSGPAQLALALVADCWGEDYAVPRIYQRVKRAVAQFPRDGWTLSGNDLDQLINGAVTATGFVPAAFSDQEEA